MMRVIFGLLLLKPGAQGLSLGRPGESKELGRAVSQHDESLHVGKTTWSEDRGGINAPWCKVKTDLPTRCTAGNDHWSLDEMRAAIPEFAKLHQSRPIRKNNGGGGINHAFALWFTIKKLQPKYIIESGVYHGGSTWLLRTTAGNDTKIFSLDPFDESKLWWRDDNPNTHYFMGEKFVDFAEMNWDDLIPKEDRANTLVFLDDHQASIRRVKEMLDHDFVHLWYDDNYKFSFAWMGLTYSFNLICSEVTEQTKNKHGKIDYNDMFGDETHEISLEQHEENLKFLQDHTEVYFEFPAVWDRCNPEGRTSLLDIGKDSRKNSQGFYDDVAPHGVLNERLQEYGLPRVLADPYNYATHYPPYVKLKH